VARRGDANRRNEYALREVSRLEACHRGGGIKGGETRTLGEKRSGGFYDDKTRVPEGKLGKKRGNTNRKRVVSVILSTMAVERGEFANWWKKSN